MIINGKKFYLNASIFYVYIKKHYCPCCGTKLSTKNDSIVINSESIEAKNYNFSVGDEYMLGNIEFTTEKFICNKCNFEASIKEMKFVEKQNKHKKNNLLQKERLGKQRTFDNVCTRGRQTVSKGRIKPRKMI